ncbi:hypothetical protein AAC387_Pa12g1441 [Persea americana]
MANHMNLLLSVLFIISLVLLPSGNGQYNVLNFGAKADRKTDSTKSFLGAWAAACASVKPATIHVPRGSYLLGHTVFNGPCKNKRINIRIDGTLVAPSNYAWLASTKQWILFHGVHGISIFGGTLDGRGNGLWTCKEAKKNCPGGATSLTFSNAEGILINGLTSINSQLYHVVINGCRDVRMEDLKIVAPGDSPNTDGIHVQRSTGVVVFGTGIKTGDDCISVGPGTRNLWVENVACGPGHGISIGSLAKEVQEAGVQNVTVKNVVFTGTTNGLRIKSWGRPSTGFVNGVVFQDVVMKNVENPIIIDQNYCPRNEKCPGQHSGVKINQVKYSNIRGTSATKVAVKFDCSQINPCKGIKLQEVKLTYQNQPAQSYCKNVQGSVSGLVDPPSCL